MTPHALLPQTGHGASGAYITPQYPLWRRLHPQDAKEASAETGAATAVGAELESVLHFLTGLLQVARGLIGLTFCLHRPVVGGLTDLVFDVTLGRLCFVLFLLALATFPPWVANTYLPGTRKSENDRANESFTATRPG
jgi:hypothetical protein